MSLVRFQSRPPLRTVVLLCRTAVFLFVARKTLVAANAVATLRLRCSDFALRRRETIQRQRHAIGNNACQLPHWKQHEPAICICATVMLSCIDAAAVCCISAATGLLTARGTESAHVERHLNRPLPLLVTCMTRHATDSGWVKHTVHTRLHRLQRLL